jgi:hypothetical protein
VSKLSGLQFKLQHKKGPKNQAVDALSSVAHNLNIFAVSAVTPVWIQEILNSYDTDTNAHQLLQELAISSPNSQGFSLSDGVIRFKGRIWVGANTAIQTKIIQAFHSSALGGHSGIQAKYQRVQRLFSCQGLKTLVDSFVRQCTVCQQAKHKNYKYPWLLSPLPIPLSSWQDIAMDFIEGLPVSNGQSVILVVVDRFTKYAHFFALKHPYTAASVASVFLNNVVKLYGLPKSIVSYRDKVFTSAFWMSLFELLNIKL